MLFCVSLSFLLWPSLSVSSSLFSSPCFYSDQTNNVHSNLLQDGAFLIRHSSNQSLRQPYTLAVLYQQKVYNIPIRFLEEMQGYALGKEGKKTEEVSEKKQDEKQFMTGGRCRCRNFLLGVGGESSVDFALFSWSLQVFSNLDEMISHHKNNQLLLIDSKSQAKHRTYLTHPAHPWALLRFELLYDLPAQL